MMAYSMVLAKLGLGLLCLILQINLLGKGNLAPNSAMDQVQNYVLGGIIGGVIYNDAITILEFLLVLIAWTLLVLILKYVKTHNRFLKVLVDGKPVTLVERGKILVDACMRYGVLANDLNLKLRMAGVYFIRDVKRAVLEPNGQLTVIQYGEKDARYPLILDGMVNQDTLALIDKDQIWLLGELAKQGQVLSNIYIGEWKDGKLTLYPYHA